MAQNSPITNITLGGVTEPDSRVIVPLGDSVRITAPSETAGASWYKDGTLLSDTSGRTLLLANLDSTSSGVYSYRGGQPVGELGNRIELMVTDIAQGHVVNYSSRVTLAPGLSTQISGFVVAGARTKALLVRAVGESLRQFGINNPVTSPRIQLYRGETPISPAIPSVVLDPTYWPRVFANCGAFPLTGNEQPWIAFLHAAFSPGAYTIHVSDDSKQGGEVLIEVYEITVPTPLSEG